MGKKGKTLIKDPVADLSVKKTTVKGGKKMNLKKSTASHSSAASVSQDEGKVKAKGGNEKRARKQRCDKGSKRLKTEVKVRFNEIKMSRIIEFPFE